MQTVGANSCKLVIEVGINVKKQNWHLILFLLHSREVFCNGFMNSSDVVIEMGGDGSATMTDTKSYMDDQKKTE